MQKLEYIPIPQAANTAGTVPVRTKPVPVRVKFPTSGDNFETVANISTAQDFMDFQKTLEHMINRDQ